jgi:PAS domain S-box-containing protein
MDNVLDLIILDTDTTIESGYGFSENPESFHQILVDSRIECCCYVGADGSILDANGPYCELVGYTREELIAMNIADLEVSDSPEQVTSTICDMLKNGSEIFGIQQRTKCGKIVDVEVNILHFGNNNSSFLIATKDITALKREKEKFQVLYNNVSEYCYMISHDGTILDLNSSALNILGYEKREVIGKHVSIIYSPESQARMKNIFQKWKDTGHLREEEMVIITKSGERHPVLLNASALFADNGKIVHSISIQKDITEKILWKKKIEDEKTKMHLLFQKSLDGIIILDKKENVCEVNKQFADMLGYSVEDICKLDPCELDTFFNQDQIVRILDDIDGEGYRFETRQKCKDGTFIDVELTVYRFVDENDELLFCICRDISGLKEAQKEIHDSELKYRSLFDQSADGIYVHNVNGDILDVNNGAVLQSGYSKEELIGMSLFDFIVDELNPKEITEQWSQWVVGQSVKIETTHRRKDGSLYPVEITSKLVEYGSKNQILAIATDITIRKNAENMLKESERLFKTFFEQSSVGVGQTTLDGNYIRVNEVFSGIVGYSCSELENMTLKEITHPDDLHLDNLYINSTISGNTDSFNIEKRLIHKNGKTIWIKLHSRTIKDENNLPVYIIEVITDISDQKRIETILTKKERQLSLAMEASEYGLWELDLDSMNIYLNPTMYTMNGYEPKDTTENLDSLLDFIHPDNRDSFQKCVKSSIIDAKPLDMDLKVKHSSNEWKWVSIKGKPVDFDENDVPHTFIGTQIDITSRVNTEKALLYARLLADEYNCMKCDMLKNITHELRTPLTAIIGFSDIMRSDDEEEFISTYRKYSEYINDSGKDLLLIINRMLDFSTVENSDIDCLELTVFGIEELISEVVDLNYEKAIRKDVSLKIKFDQDIGPISADREKLKQVLYNLIDNGIKFTDKPGLVEIKVEKLENHVQFLVRDTGIGMEEEKFETIFKPFVQIDGSRSRKYAGTGLGLALAHKIVELHNGSIKVKSEIGKGTTFVISIPMNKAVVNNN